MFDRYCFSGNTDLNAIANTNKSLVELKGVDLEEQALSAKELKYSPKSGATPMWSAAQQMCAPFNVNILRTRPQSVDTFPQTAKSRSKTARTQLKSATH